MPFGKVALSAHLQWFKERYLSIVLGNQSCHSTTSYTATGKDGAILRWVHHRFVAQSPQLGEIYEGTPKDCQSLGRRMEKMPMESLPAKGRYH